MSPSEKTDARDSPGGPARPASSGAASPGAPTGGPSAGGTRPAAAGARPAGSGSGPLGSGPRPGQGGSAPSGAGRGGGAQGGAGQGGTTQGGAAQGGAAQRGTTARPPSSPAAPSSGAAGRQAAPTAPAGGRQPAAPSAASTAAAPTAVRPARPGAEARPAEPNEAAHAAPAPAGEAPRRVRLSLSRVSLWSVARLAFLLSVALGIIAVVAVTVLWAVLNGMGVFSQLDSVISDVVGTESDFRVADLLSLSRVLSVTVFLAVVDVVLLTLISTISALLYNLASGLVGGVRLTLSDD